MKLVRYCRNYPVRGEGNVGCIYQAILLAEDIDRRKGLVYCPIDENAGVSCPYVEICSYDKAQDVWKPMSDRGWYMNLNEDDTFVNLIENLKETVL